ncbi:L,D-transpeptidase [Oscillatoria sp. FACHB-1406]|uniref:L,D-transpeptidase n=1 Tax=Oscillatoria sp. FACHB-1406 TaxID=2692846 RepID=UPI001683095B|nr:L,D-transpeptidase [Oscillatoria sp. FACHB-1406]MBD2578893.1 L,D-transpeptidase [Oscillatoria sp. FACHB-1406]
MIDFVRNYELRITNYELRIAFASGLCLLLLGNGAAYAQSNSAEMAATHPDSLPALEQDLELPPLGDSERFLPPVIEARLVLRLRDRRLYYYLGEEVIQSYPVAVGRQGWETPTGSFSVLQKVQEPTWQHPFTRKIIPPGPENPLGARWIGFWTDGQNSIGFHGTPNEELIGQAVSHGCVRMRDRDIVALYEKVEMGMPVIVEP